MAPSNVTNTPNTADTLKPVITDLFLKNADQAIVDFFSKTFPIDFEGRKTPVIFVSQERWSLMQKQKGYRDENGVLILPIITVRRSDPATLLERYVNKDSDDTRVMIKRVIAKEANDQNQTIPYSTAFMDAPIYEIITAEYPTFVKMTYKITLHTSYLSQANQLQENIWKKFDSGRSYFTSNDFYIFATIENVSDISNLDDFTNEQRMIKYEYNLNVQIPLVSKDTIKIFRTMMKPILTFNEM